MLIRIILLGLVLTTDYSSACTTMGFKTSDGMLFARNYDWYTPMQHGRVMINPRGLKKSSLLVKETDKRIDWIAKFGSVTFNQFGQEFPLGGMNEAGVVIEVLELRADTQQIPESDPRPSLNEAQIVQYLLDVSPNVQTLKALAHTVRVSQVFTGLHYMACDSKQCVLLEYLDGRLVVHDEFTNGPESPRPALLTNHPYESAVLDLAVFDQSSRSRQRRLLDGDASQARFLKGAKQVRRFRSRGRQQDRNFAFMSLSKVAMDRPFFKTIVSVVYDSAGDRVYFRSRKNPSIKSVSLASLRSKGAFECKTQILSSPLQDSLGGPIDDRLTLLTAEENKALVDANKPLPGINASALDMAAEFPGTLLCAER